MAYSLWPNVLAELVKGDRDAGIRNAGSYRQMPVCTVLRAFEESDSDKLFEMYCQFEPKGEFQGLPPRHVSQIKKWLNQLREQGFYQFVVDVDGRIVATPRCVLRSEKLKLKWRSFFIRTTAASASESSYSWERSALVARNLNWRASGFS